MLICISALLTTVLLVAIYNLPLMRASRVVRYRILLIVYFAVWSGILWVKSHEPTALFLVICLVLIWFLPVLAFIPRRISKNRQQIKAILEQLQQERRFKKIFGEIKKIYYWSILWCLIWLVCYRLIKLFSGSVS
jgi:hypothetical protein